MKIIKYKYKAASKYIITFEDREEQLYEDIIIKYNILSKKDITEEELKKYLKENQYYDLYYKALSFMKKKVRCKKELEKLLLKETNYKKNIDSIINKLEKEHILDDKLYCTCYINDAINLKNIGPNKIRKDLLLQDINENIINEQLLLLFNDELIQNKINKYINKNLRINKKSSYEFKNKMINNLIILGYNKDNIEECLKNIDINDEALYEKEYENIYKKLSAKYSGKELEYKIKAKLYAKGLTKKEQ